MTSWLNARRQCVCVLSYVAIATKFSCVFTLKKLWYFLTDVCKSFHSLNVICSLYNGCARQWRACQKYSLYIYIFYLRSTGFLSGSECYYNHFISWQQNGRQYKGYDFYENEQIAKKYKNQYSTHIFARRTIDIIRRHNDTAKVCL